MVIHPIDAFFTIILGFIFFSAFLACLGNGKNPLALASLVAGILLLCEIVAIWKYEVELPVWIPVATASMCAFWLVCWLVAVPFEERGISDPQLPGDGRRTSYLDDWN